MKTGVKLMSLLLAVLLCVSLLPVGVLADGEAEEPAPDTEAAVPAEEEDTAEEPEAAPEEKEPEPAKAPAEEPAGEPEPAKAPAPDEPAGEPEPAKAPAPEETETRAPGGEAKGTVASGTCGTGVNWTLDSAGTLTISGSGAMKDYASASAAPWAAEDIYAVAVEEGVTAVGKYAFAGLFLDNVTLPESLTKIGANAFSGAAIAEAHFAGNLKQWRENVKLGSGNDLLTSVIQMDKDVTYNADGITLANGKVVCSLEIIPDYFKTEYNDYVFEVEFTEGLTQYFDCMGMTKIQRVTLPESAVIIGWSAFNGCMSLTSVTIPNGVNTLGAYVFENCTSLASVSLGTGVTAIPNGAFYNCDSLTSITIPDSVNWIGDSAFFGCDNLASITIGSGVTSIKDQAFSDCTSLTSVTIPAKVTSIGGRAFENCSNLTSVVIPESVTIIDALAFSGCGLTDIVIPEGVTTIGNGAFCGCRSLTSIRIPDSVTGIGESVFCSCSNLVNVQIGSGLISLGQDGEGEGLFAECTALQSIVIPENITHISIDAFARCTSLTSITIPDSVSSIGANAFFECSSLTDITIPDGVTSIEDWTFMRCTSLTSVTIPASVTSIGKSAFLDCEKLTDIYFDGTAAMWNNISIAAGNESLASAVIHPAIACGETGDCRWTLRDDGLLKILGSGKMADYANGEAPWYAYRDQITAILVKPNVTSIGKYAFSGLTALGTVTGMDGVTGVGEGAFKNCAKLTGLSIPGTVSTMGKNVFAGCTKLTSAGPAGSGAAIVFGWSKVIPAYAFYGANCLKTLTVPAGVTRIMSYAAYNCTALTAATLPSTLTTIQQYAFSGCKKLTTVTIPANVTSIGDSAFKSCTGLARVTIPANVTSIGKNAFSGCTGLTSVTIPASVTSVGSGVFSNCAGLTAAGPVGGGYNIEFGWTASIPEYAFDGCGSLTTVTIPKGVTSIGERAFSGCTGLTDVHYGGSTASWGRITIGSSNDPLTAAAKHYAQYAVTFAKQSGAVISALDVDANGTIKTLPTTEATGYTFKGWYTAKSGGTKLTTSTKITKDITYYAQWTTNNYTVTFAKQSGAVITTVTKPYNTAIGELPTTETTGYTFAGWYTAKSGGTKITENTKVKGDVTYYAHWTPNDYTVTFAKQSGAVIATKTAAYNTAIGTLPTAETQGYTFTGWYTAKSGGTKITSSTKVKGDVTYYAHWTINDYTVTFAKQSGAVIATKTVTYNTAIGELPTAETQGYTFTGWYTAKSGGTKITSSTKVKGDVTYYAHWTINDYTVTFAKQSGAVIATVTLPYGSKLSELPTAETEGYTFTGWYTAKSGGTKISANTKVTKDVTYYAHWKANDYTVTFAKQNGTVIATKTGAYGTAIGTLPTTEAPGYTFTGWYTAKSGGTKITASTKYTKDMTVYAHWTKN